VPDEVARIEVSAAMVTSSTARLAAGAADTRGGGRKETQVDADACNRDRNRGGWRMTGAANEETATVEQPRYSDADITSAVQGRLYADHDIRGGRVDVSADNGVVTMRGMVSSEESKRQALQIAKGVEGVTSVRDELKIRPPEGAGSLSTDEPAGERLAAATNAAWLTSPKKSWETAVLKAHGHIPQWTKKNKALTVESRAALDAIDLHFHDLRHEAGSRLLERGWALHHVQAMLGSRGRQGDEYLPERHDAPTLRGDEAKSWPAAPRCTSSRDRAVAVCATAFRVRR
jgi:hyperosmotically inducible periplasmic protein